MNNFSTRQRGIALMLFSMFLLASMDGAGKHLTHTYSIFQVMWVRFLFLLPLVSLLALRKGVYRPWRSQQPRLQIIRSLILLFEIAFFILSFKYLPLADVHAIASASPLLATALAVPLLKEKVDFRRWAAVLIGLVGVLVIIQPGLSSFSYLSLIPLLSAALWGLYQVLVKAVSTTDNVETGLFYTASIGVIALSFIAPFSWVTPDIEGWFFLTLVALLGCGGHFFMMKAFELAPASALQPFNYTLVVWATIIGAIGFGDLPGHWTIIGAGIVVAGGLYAFRREHIDDRRLQKSSVS
ncbi:MAG: DMT family transporter [Alphaproteobacteria bacterium]